MKKLRVRFEVKLSRKLRQTALAALLMALYVPFIDSESVTLSTYYPSPGGVYSTLTTTGDTDLAINSVVSSRLGIGTTAPDYHMNTLVSGYMRSTFYGSGGAPLMQLSSNTAGGDGLGFYTGPREVLTVAHDGRVGIGTTNPTLFAKLTVGDGAAGQGRSIRSRQAGCSPVMYDPGAPAGTFTSCAGAPGCTAATCYVTSQAGLLSQLAGTTDSNTMICCPCSNGGSCNFAAYGW